MVDLIAPHEMYLLFLDLLSSFKLNYKMLYTHPSETEDLCQMIIFIIWLFFYTRVFHLSLFSTKYTSWRSPNFTSQIV